MLFSQAPIHFHIWKRRMLGFIKKKVLSSVQPIFHLFPMFPWLIVKKNISEQEITGPILITPIRKWLEPQTLMTSFLNHLIWPPCIIIAEKLHSSYQCIFDPNCMEFKGTSEFTLNKSSVQMIITSLSQQLLQDGSKKATCLYLKFV